VGFAAERTGYWDSELVRAEYTGVAVSARVHRSQATREPRLLLNTASRFSPASAVLTYSISERVNRLKDFGRIATRYDKLAARNYPVCFVAALV
jgi:hypothetical protein